MVLNAAGRVPLRSQNVRRAPPARLRPGKRERKQPRPREKRREPPGRVRPAVPPSVPPAVSDIPLSPPPLLSPRDLVLIGAGAALAWLWGWLNGRGQIQEQPRLPGYYPLPSAGRVSFTTTQSSTGRRRYTCATGNSAGYTNGITGSPTSVNIQNVVGIEYFGDACTSQTVCGSTIDPTPQVIGLWLHLSSGSIDKTGSSSHNRYNPGGAEFSDPYTITRKTEGLKFNGGDYYLGEVDRVVDPGTLAPTPIPLPPGTAPAPLPERERQPLAPPVPPGDPLAPPLAPPEAPPSPAPLPPGVAPGTRPDENRPPWPFPPTIPVPVPRPPDEGAPEVGDGSVTVKPKPPTVPQTPPGVETTPDGPVGGPGNSPPATLEGIAAEVGKVEGKVLQLLRRPSPPGDLGGIQDAISSLLEYLSGLHPAGGYTLTAPCEEGVTVTASWSAGSGSMDLLGKKLDAVAELIQAHKDMRQPICHVRAQGQSLSVDFVEDRAGTWEDRPIRKTLSYRDQGGGSLESHTAGWQGFSFDAGGVQVVSQGKWGKVQVYAASVAEAKRVIRHAAGLAGYDLEGDPDHQWIVGYHEGGRIGRSGRVIVKPTRTGIAVRWRDGPSGRAYTQDV